MCQINPGLNVGVDGLNLALSKGTGVATYARTLITALSDMGCGIDLLFGLPIAMSSPRFHDFLERLNDEHFPPRPHFPEIKWWIENFQHMRGHTALQIAKETGGLPENLLKISSRVPPHNRLFNVDFLFKAAQGFFRTTGRFLTITIPDAPEIMHWTYPVPIRLAEAYNVYTIHDLVPLLLPHTTLDNKPVYKRLISKIVRDADAICTVSASSRDDILRLFPESHDRLVNTFQAFIPEPVFNQRSVRQHASIIKKYLNYKPGAYYIFFGQLEPKKNIDRLLRAFLSSSARFPLVLVGSTGWKQEKELSLLPEALQSGRIVHIPYLPKADLMTLLCYARALLFPSISEGFGLPVLEAFSLGTPVLTSDQGALREVSGKSALLVDPYDVSSIRNGINLLDQNDDICRKLKDAGRKRSEVFSIDHYEERLSDFYRKIMLRKKK